MARSFHVVFGAIHAGFGSPRKVNGFARGSPTRGAVERSETERLYEGKPDREPLLDSTSPSRLRRATSPTEGRLWHVGQVHAGRAKHDVSGTVVLRCQDSRQLDKVRCPEAAALCSKARPFTPRRAFSGQAKVARPAKGSPFGGAGERSETERARMLRQNKNTAIR